MEILTLFLTFFKIGFLAFGGGWTVLGVINHAVISHGWLSSAEFSQIVSVSQLTPGPVAVNVATYVGFKICGIWGSVVSTLGILLPSILIISSIAFIGKYVKRGKKRLNVALKVVGTSLIILTLYSLTSSHADWLTITLAGVSFFFFVKTKVDPVYVILFSAFLGAVIYLFI